jgi:hypothetical protein
VGASQTPESGVATPFSLANALNWIRDNAVQDTTYTIVLDADETLMAQTIDSYTLNYASNVTNP